MTGVCASTAKPRASQSLGVVLVLLAVIFIALTPNAAKIAYLEGANTMAVVTSRCIVGMLGIALYLTVRSGWAQVGWSTLRNTSWSGLTQAMTALGMIGAVAFIDVSLTILIIFLHPFLIAIIGHLRGESRLSPAHFATIVVAVLGLGLALGVTIDSLDPRGLALAVIGLFGATMMILSVARVSHEIGAIPANFYMTLWASTIFVAAAVLGPSAGLWDAVVLPATFKGWVAIIGTGVAFSMGYVLFFRGAMNIGTTRAATLTIIEPVLTILYAIGLVGEWLTALQWLGVALVVAALLYIELPRGTLRKRT